MFGTLTTSNDKNGSGKYSTPRRRKKQSTATKPEFSYLTSNDKRLGFDNAQDPIYYIFQCVESQSITSLAKEFVEDSFFQITEFVSKVIK